MSTKHFIMTLFLLAFLPLFAYGYCTPNSYLTAGGTDYFFVNTFATNTTAMNDTQLFVAYTAFTPRLNFTKPVNQTSTAGNTTVSVGLTWFVYNNINSSLVVTLANGTLIDAGNYSWVWINQLAGTSALTWLSDEFSGQAIVLNFNRTFVKNVDDLTVPATTVKSDTTMASWLTTNTPANYGDDKTFQLNRGVGGYGGFVNNTNWAVTWNFRGQTCDTTACSGVNNIIVSTLVTIFLIGILVFIAFMAYSGNLSTPVIVGAVVAVIFLLIGLAIINGLLSNLCLGG